MRRVRAKKVEPAVVSGVWVTAQGDAVSIPVDELGRAKAGHQVWRHGVCVLRVGQGEMPRGPEDF